MSDELIASLKADLKPVRPLAPVTSRIVPWAALSVVAAGAVVAAIGLRHDLRAALGSVAAPAHSVVLALAAACGAAAALRLSIPGEARRSAVVIPVALVAVWVAWLVGELVVATPDGWHGGNGWACAAKTLAAGAAAGGVLVAMVRRGASLDARAVALLAGVSMASVGALAAEWMCPIAAPVHLLIWHAGSAIALSLLALVAGAGMVHPEGLDT